MSPSSVSFLSAEQHTPTPNAWRDRYCFFLSRGYELPISLALAAGEDSVNSMAGQDFIDAMRMSDGLSVCIRRTTRVAAEAHAHAAARAHPPWDHMYNHIAPILEIISDESTVFGRTYI